MTGFCRPCGNTLTQSNKNRQLPLPEKLPHEPLEVHDTGRKAVRPFGSRTAFLFFAFCDFAAVISFSADEIKQGDLIGFRHLAQHAVFIEQINDCL